MVLPMKMMSGLVTSAEEEEEQRCAIFRRLTGNEGDSCLIKKTEGEKLEKSQPFGLGEDLQRQVPAANQLSIECERIKYLIPASNGVSTCEDNEDRRKNEA